MHDDTLYKLGRPRGDEKVPGANPVFDPVERPPVFLRETTAGVDRLIIAYPRSGPDPLRALIACLDEPFSVLYLLHLSRNGRSQPGRYESPELSRAEIVDFLTTHHEFLAKDARHDVWVHAFAADATLVWDRHDLVYAYGPLDPFESALMSAGFVRGEPDLPFPHVHRYHAAFDGEEAAVLEALAWRRSPLEPGDEQ